MITITIIIITMIQSNVSKYAANQFQVTTLTIHHRRDSDSLPGLILMSMMMMVQRCSKCDLEGTYPEVTQGC
eukprot:6496777-Karenia_brevis.AAC.1